MTAAVLWLVILTFQISDDREGEAQQKTSAAIK